MPLEVPNMYFVGGEVAGDLLACIRRTLRKRSDWVILKDARPNHRSRRW